LLDIYWNILTMHVPINVKSPNNISKWQMGFNSAFKGLTPILIIKFSDRFKQIGNYYCIVTFHKVKIFVPFSKISLFRNLSFTKIYPIKYCY
jgi:hypothetical protein